MINFIQGQYGLAHILFHKKMIIFYKKHICFEWFIFLLWNILDECQSRTIRFNLYSPFWSVFIKNRYRSISVVFTKNFSKLMSRNNTIWTILFFQGFSIRFREDLFILFAIYLSLTNFISSFNQTSLPQTARLVSNIRCDQ